MRFRPLTLVLVALAAAASAASAQKPAPAPASKPAAKAAAGPARAPKASADSLPAAETILAKYVAAIGGRDAVLKRTSIRSTGTFEMPAAGLKGELVLVQGLPNRTAMIISVPGLGEMVSGFDGTVGWSVNPMQGARVLEGPELAAMREDSGIRSILREGEGRTSRTVGRTEMGGEPCWQVKVDYPSGREVTECYSVASGLFVGAVAMQESPMGVIPVTTLMSDWREFDGVKMATRARMQMMGQEQVMTVTSVTFDGAEDARAFERPAAVTTILEQKAKAPAP